MKKLLFFLLCLIPGILSAQTYEEFLRQRQQEYKEYIDKQNQEFIQFLKERWKEYPVQAPVARPKKPEPVKPVLFDKAGQPEAPVEIIISGVNNLSLPVAGGKTPATVPLRPVIKDNIPVITVPERSASPKPVGVGNPSPKPEKKKPEQVKPPVALDKPLAGGVPPVVKTPVPALPEPGKSTRKEPLPTVSGTLRTSGVSVDFYGNSSFITPVLNNSFTLQDISEKSVAKAWEDLCRKDYKELVSDCKNLRSRYALNDWGYVLLTGKIASSLCKGANEKVFMQMFLLCQSGYKAKVARMDNELILLVATDSMLYGQSYFTINNERYFMLERDRSGSVYTYNKDFSHSSGQICMSITDKQLIEGTTKKSVHQSKAYSNVRVQSEVNEELIAFYKDYPQCEFPIYATAPVSDEVRNSVLPPLREAITGKSEKEAANILLNFVQTGFAYQTDDEQFGYEKPFFVDELFYYPACDCEDRSVLFSYLVRTLMGLDVVLLDYPNHIATAVRFNEEIQGDFVILDGKKYLICDPTFINASIGKAMPQFRDAQVEVIRF